MKNVRLKTTKVDFQEENLEVFVLDKATAARLVQDLVEGLAGTGTGFTAFRDGHRFFVFKVDDK